MDIINIVNIDKYIRDKINEEYIKLDEYMEEKQKLEKEDRTLTEEYKKITGIIKDIQTKKLLNLYIVDTFDILLKFKELMNKPLRISFMSNRKDDEKIEEQRKLFTKYINIIKKYNIINIDKYIKPKKYTSKPQTMEINCNNCNNTQEFINIDVNTILCMECFSQQTFINHTSSYRDSERINTFSKYMYDRKIHFRDCIKQYQGKQNCKIDENVFSDLENEFRKHYLLIDSNVKEIKFSKITKQHILLFLKELKYPKHYENLHLIYHQLTNRKLDDISHLENKLLTDFDTLSNLYDKVFSDTTRKNFINTQYVLYQLLLKHKHKCKKEDFFILKTVERKNWHDEVCEKLFTILNWNYTSLY